MTDEKRQFDAEPERELINTLRTVGASDVFITMIQTSIEGTAAEKNSCLWEVNKWVRWNDGEVTEKAMKPNYGGSFFTAMWEGDVGNAYSRADNNNRALLVEAFGKKYIEDQRVNTISGVSA